MNPSITLSIFLAFTSFISAEEAAPLNNKQLQQIGTDWTNPEKKKPNLIGKRVKILVIAKKRSDDSVYCTIASTDPQKKSIWNAHLTNFQRNFSKPIADMKANKNYMIIGVIVENRIDYGAFWIYVNSFTEVDGAKGEKN